MPGHLRQVDKQTQLLIFINSAYLGNYHDEDIVGFQATAQAYFQKDFSKLTKDEFISLTAMLVAPNNFNVANQSEQNRERVTRIKHLLNGECQPTGYTDIYYESCAAG